VVSLTTIRRVSHYSSSYRGKIHLPSRRDPWRLTDTIVNEARLLDNRHDRNNNPALLIMPQANAGKVLLSFLLAEKCREQRANKKNAFQSLRVTLLAYRMKYLRMKTGENQESRGITIKCCTKLKKEKKKRDAKPHDYLEWYLELFLPHSDCKDD